MVLDQDLGDLEEKETRGPCNDPERSCDLVEKNGVIQVIVDDLSEGVIVVSYTLNDNLYQGVLLQLNRERGIPCGISFPKDFCSPQSGITAEEQVEVPPINQRQTYFQSKDVPGGISSPVKTGHGLRKIVKPPARFVNARSLRMRHRPTLCLKCKALCVEKSQEGQPKSSSVGKILPGTRKNIGKPAVSPVVSNEFASSQKKEDFSFVSVGSKDFIENYWKRPSLTAPVLEDCSKILEPRTDDQIYDTPPILNVVKSEAGGAPEFISSHTEVLRPAQQKVTVKKPNLVPKLLVSTHKTVLTKAKGGKKGLTNKRGNAKIAATATSHLKDQTSGNTPLESESTADATNEPDSLSIDLTSLITKPTPVAPSGKLIITLPNPLSGSFARKTPSPVELKACRAEAEAVTVSSSASSMVEVLPAMSTESPPEPNGKTIKESFKTPAIKICVGDLMLKIPPKLKEEDGESTETISDRKLRKAIRKLKKDARRKLSLSREGSPDLSLCSTGLELHSELDAQNRVPISPPTINGPMFEAAVEHFQLAAVRKKKKDKKKKKSRPYKDNDLVDDENGNSALVYSADYAGGLLPGAVEQHSSASVSSSPSNGVGSDSMELIRDSSPALEDSEERIESAPKRLCLSLKRYTTDSSTSWDIASSLVPDASDEETPLGAHDVPVNSSSGDLCLPTSASVDSGTDSSSSVEYKTGEVVWGKLSGCPWWPAKILNIVTCDTENDEEASAHVSWYKAQTESKVRFSQLVPFMSEYDAKYVRSRKRGNYQNAVQEALEELGLGQEKPTASS